MIPSPSSWLFPASSRFVYRGLLSYWDLRTSLSITSIVLSVDILWNEYEELNKKYLASWKTLSDKVFNSTNVLVSELILKILYETKWNCAGSSIWTATCNIGLFFIVIKQKVFEIRLPIQSVQSTHILQKCDAYLKRWPPNFLSYSKKSRIRDKTSFKYFVWWSRQSKLTKTFDT